jgi:RPA family protein
MSGKISKLSKRLGFSGMLATGISLTLLLCSCALVDWFSGNVSDQEVKDMDKDLGKAVQKQTVYDDSLKKFGLMLEAYNIPQIRVQSKLIKNETAEKDLPDSVSGMLSSAVNKIGPSVIYVPFDPNYVISETTTGGDIKRALPKIVIAGGITEFDKELIEKKRELKGKASVGDNFGSNYDYDGGAGYKAGSAMSRMTLDLQLMEYQTQTYMPGVQTINSINLRKTELGWSVGFFFEGNGFSFDYSLNKKQGKYQALRLLVELSVLEVLGKYFDVPYWQCLEGAPPDTRQISRLKEEFDGLNQAQQYSYLKEYLFFHGVPGIDRTSGGISDKEIALIKSKMQELNCPDYGSLFLKLWETVPLVESRKRIRQHSKDQNETAQKAQEDVSKKIAQYNSLIEQADALFNQGALAQSRELYRQAGLLFPDQPDPKSMMSRIDNQLAAQNQPASKAAPVQTAAAPQQQQQQQQQQEQPAAPPPAKQAGPAKKEAPLNMFQKNEEW